MQILKRLLKGLKTLSKKCQISSNSPKILCFQPLVCDNNLQFATFTALFSFNITGMVHDALATLLQKKDINSKRALYELLYPRFAAMAKRYSKNSHQAKDCLHAGFQFAWSDWQQSRNIKPEQAAYHFEKAFLKGIIAHLKSIRNEYYVSSTVHAIEPTRPYDLFASMVAPPDYKQAPPDALLNALQKLVPAQRLIFNLHVIDGVSLEEASEMLDSSAGTIKSNLEKARYNFQKHLDTFLRNNQTQTND